MARAPEITAQARSWLISLACRTAKDVGCPHELWTTRLLAGHAHGHGPAEGHACLTRIAQGTVCRILAEKGAVPRNAVPEARPSAVPVAGQCNLVFGWPNCPNSGT